MSINDDAEQAAREARAQLIRQRTAENAERIFAAAIAGDQHGAMVRGGFAAGTYQQLAENAILGASVLVGALVKADLL